MELGFVLIFGRFLSQQFRAALLTLGLFCAPVLAQVSPPSPSQTGLAETWNRVKGLAIWQHGWHMNAVLRRDEELSELCRQRQFNQRFLLLHRAVFATRYTVGVAWKNPNVLIDPGHAARRDQIYYFYRDGGRDAFDRCDVYVQDVPEEFVVE